MILWIYLGVMIFLLISLTVRFIARKNQGKYPHRADVYGAVVMLLSASILWFLYPIWFVLGKDYIALTVKKTFAKR